MVVALVVPLVLTQRHLKEVRTELARTNEQVVQDRAASDQLEQTISNLNAELDTANKTLALELKENLDETTSDASTVAKGCEVAQSQLKDREAQTRRLTSELDKARRNSDQKIAAEHEASESQIEALTKTADDAKAKLSEAEKQIADLKEQLATTSTQLKQESADKAAAQSKLRETQSQLESVNGELAKTKEAAQQANATADDATNTAKTLKDALDQANAEIERLKTDLDQRPLPPASISPPGENSHPRSDRRSHRRRASLTPILCLTTRIMALPSSVTVLDHTFLDRSRRH